MGIYCGIDIGSTTSEIVLRENERIISYRIFSTGINVKKNVGEKLNECLAEVDKNFSHISHITTTGYGRRLIDFADVSISEISANAKGALWLSNDSIRTIIDIGGQDSKAISIDENGKIVNFAMNDKCAAGTGRFLDVMARALDVKLEDMGELSLKANSTVNINSMCTVFAESEVISLLARGCPANDISAGLHRAIAKRVGQQVKRVGLKEKVFFSGGGALNKGLKKAIEEELNTELIVYEVPQIVSAVGASLVGVTNMSQSVKVT